MSRQVTAIIRREGDGYVSLCPEPDIASQGDTIEGARDNLREALELFFECASPDEIERRRNSVVYRRRSAEIDSGAVTPIPWEQVKRVTR